MLRPVASLLAAALLLFGHIDAQAAEINGQRDIVNNGVVGVMGGSFGGTNIELAANLAQVLDDGYDMRVLPIVGKGSVRAVEDLLLLRGIDIAIVQSDVLEFYKKTKIYPNIEDNLRYITRLLNEEVHIVARNDIKSINDLTGKKVNFGPDSSGTFMTASIIFDRLQVPVEIVSEDFSKALDSLKQGKIDAWVRLSGKPMKVLGDIKKEDNLHLLPIPIDVIGKPYVAADFTNDDYPDLIAAGPEVATVAVPSVMAVYNWQESNTRYGKVVNFVDRFAQNFSELMEEPYHPKWKQVDLNSDVPGWTRFAPATAAFANSQ